MGLCVVYSALGSSLLDPHAKKDMGFHYQGKESHSHSDAEDGKAQVTPIMVGISKYE